MLMLLSVHVTSVLFLVLAGNFALTMGGVTCSYSSRPFLYTLVSFKGVAHMHLED